ncbi:hypothetical protein AB1Y20_002889 [Prymnesium parvum]|uniref:VWFA domain-containing protein n=1 Tax=Prymnesium parvum TaxID=97485 RepID=A0AB34JAF9_PRYPA
MPSGGGDDCVAHLPAPQTDSAHVKRESSSTPMSVTDSVRPFDSKAHTTGTGGVNDEDRLLDAVNRIKLANPACSQREVHAILVEETDWRDISVTKVKKVCAKLSKRQEESLQPLTLDASSPPPGADEERLLPGLEQPKTSCVDKSEYRVAAPDTISKGSDDSTNDDLTSYYGFPPISDEQPGSSASAPMLPLQQLTPLLPSLPSALLLPPGRVEMLSDLTLTTRKGKCKKVHALMPGFSPALGSCIPSKMIMAHRVDSPHSSEGLVVMFPHSVKDALAFVQVPQWGDMSDNSVLAQFAHECTKKGASAVLLGLPQVSWILFGSSRKWSKWGWSFSLDDWAKWLDSLPQPNAVAPITIPVLLVMHNVAEELATAWKDAAIDRVGRSKIPILKSEWEYDVPSLARQTSKPSLMSNKISELISGSLTEQDFKEVEGIIRRSVLQFDMPAIVELLSSRSSDNDWPFFLLIAESLIQRSSTDQERREARTLRHAFLDKHVFSGNWRQLEINFFSSDVPALLDDLMNRVLHDATLGDSSISISVRDIVSVYHLFAHHFSSAAAEKLYQRPAKGDVVRIITKTNPKYHRAVGTIIEDVGGYQSYRVRVTHGNNDITLNKWLTRDDVRLVGMMSLDQAWKLTVSHLHGVITKSPILNLKELGQALQEFRQDNPLSDDERAVLVSALAPCARAMKEIEVLMTAVIPLDSEIPDSLQHSLATQLDAALTTALEKESIEQMVEGIENVHFKRVLFSLLESPQRLAAIGPTHLTAWLVSKEYSIHSVPDAEQVILACHRDEIAQRCTDLAEFLLLFEAVLKNCKGCDTGMVQKAFDITLQRFIKRQGSGPKHVRFLAAVSALAENAERLARIGLHVGTVGPFLSKACEGLLTDEGKWSTSSSALAMGVFGCIEKVPSLFETVGVMAAEVLLPQSVCRPAGDACELHNSIDHLLQRVKRGPTAAFVLVLLKRAMSCFPTDYEQMLELLEGVPSPGLQANSLLCVALALGAKALHLLDDDVEELAPIRQDLDGMTRAFGTLIKQVNEDKLRKSELQRLIKHHEALALLQPSCSPQRGGGERALQFPTEKKFVEQVERFDSATSFLMSRIKLLHAAAELGAEHTFQEMLSTEPSISAFEQMQLVQAQTLEAAVKNWLQPLLSYEKLILYFSENSSVLFRYFLNNAMLHHQHVSSELLGSEVLPHVSEQLEDLLRGASFATMKVVCKELTKAGRTSTDELQIIAGFFQQQEAVANTVSGLRSAFQLGQLATLLQQLVDALSQCNFSCFTDANDDDMVALRADAAFLNNDSNDCNIDKCVELRASIHRRLQGSFGDDDLIEDNSHEECVGILLFFARLANADLVWRFVTERKYFGVEGLSNFNSKLTLITNQLNGPADEQLLNQLDPVVRCVATAAENLCRPFSEIVAAVRADQRIMSKARRADPERFRELERLQPHMDRLTAWFTTGLGGLDAVFSQFESVCSTGTYEFCLRKARLQLTYSEYGHAQDPLLSESLTDFEQRLGFVQYDTKAAGLQITQFLTELQTNRKAFALMCELHVLGHPDYLDREGEPLRLPVLRAAPGVPLGCNEWNKFEPAELHKILESWGLRLEQISVEHAFLRFYSTKEAQRLHELVHSARGSSLEPSLLLCPLYPRDTSSFARLRAAVKAELQTDALVAKQQHAWPAAVGGFLNAVEMRMGSSILPLRPSTAVAVNPQWSGIHIHTTDASAASQLNLILSVYERLPEPFEFLWCDACSSVRSVEAFLARAKHHRDRCFMLLQVEMLPTNVQQLLLKHLLECKDDMARAAVSQNLHAVQTGNGKSILNVAHWISQHSSANKLSCEQAQRILRSFVLGEDISSVHYLVGDSGSGKTHMAKKQLTAWQSEGRPTAVFSIHEGFSLESIARQLHQVVLQHDGAERMGLCFHINLGRFKRAERKRWDDLMHLIHCFLFALLVLRSIQDPTGSFVFNVPPACGWSILVEIPHRPGHLDEAQPVSDAEGVLQELPTLAYVGEKLTPPATFDVGPEARLDVVFVLDNSGSMDGGPLATCKRAMLNDIFPSRLSNQDRVGLIVFNTGIQVDCPLAQWTLDRTDTRSHRYLLESKLQQVRAEGGTNLWFAMQHAIASFGSTCARSKWLVALTDGASSGSPHVVYQMLRAPGGQDIRVLFITVNLSGGYEHAIRNAVIRAPGDTLIRADGGMGALEQAWKDVGERLTVSQKIEKTEPTEGECHLLLRSYMRLEQRSVPWSMLKQAHWLNYMNRRVHILRSSDKFNKNTSLKDFGSTTMQIMLSEVELSLSDDFRHNWALAGHEHLVPWEDASGDAKWSFIATNPAALDVPASPGQPTRRELLQRLQMHVPTVDDLRDRRVLDSYLALALGIELQDKERRSGWEMDVGTLSAIDEQNFVLTLDFLMKMLCINERVACRVPCVMEGETGVSKTALTRMYFLLKNSSIRADAYAPRNPMVQELEKTIQEEVDRVAGEGEGEIGDKLAASVLKTLQLLHESWHGGTTEPLTWTDISALATNLTSLLEPTAQRELAHGLLDVLKGDPCLDAPPKHVRDAKQSSPLLGPLLSWYVRARMVQLTAAAGSALSWTFHQLNVHAALTPSDLEADLLPVIERAQRLEQLAELLDSKLHRNVTICCFFDEMNTSSFMGVFKELLTDRRLNGRDLPSNVELIAATNPARDKLAHLTAATARRAELGKVMAMGHYQVHQLPLSIEQVTWNFGALSPAQEVEFVEKRLRMLYSVSTVDFPLAEQVELASLIQKSQELTRKFAYEHIAALSASAPTPLASSDEVRARASSVVSLRDIMRVFKLFAHFNQFLALRLVSTEGACQPLIFSSEEEPEYVRRRRAMLLTISVVYFLRLSPEHRERFQRELHRDEVGYPSELRLVPVLSECMDTLLQSRHTEIEPGIARTQGLKENIFMVATCLSARVPLMIIGPPGSSKTLSVNIVAANAKGDLANPKSFYKTQDRLIQYHYQCSRKSTSTEVEAVFQRAMERQKACSGGTRCFVFMDEAGLPEEERESLKVLHYYLEDHMLHKAKVGFIAIANHNLDAAKANRCVQHFRGEPDSTELLDIAWGVLGTEQEQRRLRSQPVAGLAKPVHEVLKVLCETYQTLMSETEARPESLAWFDTFFGLRDFMYFVKQLGRLSKESFISLEKIIHALERNFNGVEEADLHQLLSFWLQALGAERRRSISDLRNPLDLLRENLAEQGKGATPIARYKLIIDTTLDDSVLRMLHNQGHLGSQTHLLKLSNFAEDAGLQQVNLISRVKYAAEKGEVVTLSQTESCNESFYDLVNLRFHVLEDRESNPPVISYHSNIAVGAHSKLCLVSPGFDPIFHLSEAKLHEAPAPFLNRFEKLRLTHAHLLKAQLQDLPPGARSLADKVLTKARRMLEHVGLQHCQGAAKLQTVESVLADLIGTYMQPANQPDQWVAPAALCRDLDELLLAEVEAELQADDDALAVVASELLPTWNVDRVIKLIVQADSFFRKAEDAQSAGARVGVTLLGHWLLRTSVRRLLEVVTPERLCMLNEHQLLRTYLVDQEHFSLKRLLRRLLVKHDCGETLGVKRIVYTRTSAALLAMPTYDLGTVDSAASEDRKLLESLICEPFDLPSGGRATIANFMICPLSRIRTQEALISALDTFCSQEGKLVFLVFINMADAHTSRDTVNYVRQKVDELSRRSASKHVVLVLHSPASNVHIRSYETTWGDRWQFSFLDSVSEEASALGPLDVCEWLKLGVSDPNANDSCHQLVDPKQWSVRPALEGWLPNALIVTASRIDFPVGTTATSFNPTVAVSLQERVQLLDRALQTTLHDEGDSKVTVKDVLYDRYCALWSADDHAPTRFLIRDRIRKLVRGELHLSLVEAITGEVRDMFANYCTQLIAAVDDELNLDLLDDVTLMGDEVQELYVMGLRAMPLPTVCKEVKLLTQRCKINVTHAPPRPNSMFPFFAGVYTVFEQATTDGLGTASEDDQKVWVDAVTQLVQASDVCMAQIARRLLDEMLSDEIWRRYLCHFVTRLYPRQSAASIEHDVLRAWLDSHLSEVAPERRAATLHVLSRKQATFLHGICASLEPLSRLVSTLGQSSSLAQAICEAVRDGGHTLDGVIVQEFFEQMGAAHASDQARPVPEPISIRAWSEVFGVASLHELGKTKDEERATCVDIMTVVHLVTEHSKPSDNKRLHLFCRRLISTWSTGTWSPQHAWELVHELYAADAQLKYRLLERWCLREALLPFVFSEPVLSTLPINVAASLVERVLRGGAALYDFTYGAEILDLSSNPAALQVIEAKLASSDEGAKADLEFAYVPSWFTSASVPLDRTLAHAYFHVLLKHLQRRHTMAASLRDILPLCARLQRDLRAPGSNLRTRHLRSIMLGAVRAVIVFRLATQLAQIATSEQMPEQLLSRDVTDLLLPQQLSAMVQADAEWSFELMHCLSSELGGAPAARAFVSQAAPRLQAELGEWLEPWVGDNGEAWDRLDDFSSRHPPVRIKLQGPKLSHHAVFEDALTSESSLTTKEQRLFIQTFMRGSPQQRCLWALPDLIQFYAWLHELLDGLMREDVARSITIGELLHRYSDGTHALSEVKRITGLWERVKAGMNRFLALPSSASLGLEPIDDTQPLWRFLTIHAQVGAPDGVEWTRAGGEEIVLRGDCLFPVIQAMVEAHNAFLEKLDFPCHTLDSDRRHVEPSRLTYSDIALGDVRPLVLAQSMDDRAVAHIFSQLDEERLDPLTCFATTIERQWQHGNVFDLDGIADEVRRVYLGGLQLIDSPAARLRKVLRLDQDGEALGAELQAKRLLLELEREGFKEPKEMMQLQSLYLQLFHSLEYEQAQALLRGLGTVFSHAQSAHEIADTTVVSQLQAMFPFAPTSELLQCTHVELKDEEQAACLLQTRFSELPALVLFLHSYLVEQDFLFAHVPLQLKQSLPAEVREELLSVAEGWGEQLSREARQLESTLIEYEPQLGSQPEDSLHHFLRRVPLFAELLPPSVCAKHYKELRKILHRWAAAAQSKEEVPSGPWSWRFLTNDGDQQLQATSRAARRDNAELAGLWTLWFEMPASLHDASEAAIVRDLVDEIITEIVQNATGGSMSLDDSPEDSQLAVVVSSMDPAPTTSPITWQLEEEAELPEAASDVPVHETRLAAGKNDWLVSLVASKQEQIYGARESRKIAQQKLNAAMVLSPADTSLAKLEEAIQLAGQAGLPERELLEARQKLDRVRTQRQKVEMQLSELMGRRLHEMRPELRGEAARSGEAAVRVATLAFEEPLRQAIQDAEDVGASAELISEAQRIIESAESARREASDRLSEAISTVSPNHGLDERRLDELRQTISRGRAAGCEAKLVERLEELLKRAEKEDSEFVKTFISRWGDDAAAQLAQSASAWKELPQPTSWLPTDERTSSAAQQALRALANKDADAAAAAFDERPLSNTSWPHGKPCLALALASDPNGTWKQDAFEAIDEYIKDMAASREPMAPVLLLAIARAEAFRPTPVEALRVGCLRRCAVSLAELLTEAEHQAMQPPAVLAAAPATGRKLVPLSPAEEWALCKAAPCAIACPALDFMFEKLVGLKEVKARAFQLYKTVLADKAFPDDMRMGRSLNFALLGNPGTGKTTVARKLGELLHQLGVRKGTAFIETDGEKLAREGADKAEQAIKAAMDGVLFIDEAYALDPERNADGRAVFMQLLAAAENHRARLTIILAGYKSDIEQKLYEFNDGFASRFTGIEFEDYDTAELRQIFAGECGKWGYSEEVLDVAARRLARSRGRKSFGNARDARSLAEASVDRAKLRGSWTIEVVDVIGPPPDREHVPELAQALAELDQMTGLRAVKKAVSDLVTLAATNYKRELEGEAPFKVPLNRLLLGNPGTGKTTFAKVYGRILKGLGLLSNGGYESKLPADFTGAVVGESEKKTQAILKRCRGKVLVIDEAYSLNESSFGRIVLDTIVSNVHNAPGEDISVLLLGYEKQMKKMLREANPGLESRFGLDAAFRFEDFTDKELEQVVLREAERNNLYAPRDLVKVVVKHISRQRFRANFGNARLAISLVGRAMERLVARDGLKKLELTDFGISDGPPDAGAVSALSSLFKIEHVERHLEEVKAVLLQCKADGMDPSSKLQSYVFVGNPGTGKTTIARALAHIWHGLGLLGTDQIKCVSGLDLQGAYVGQTAPKVTEAMEEAQGGVLFIDEAYTLGAGPFGQEAVDQLVQLMTEPQHKQKTAVILAGYPAEMDSMMATCNPGLRSRVCGRIEFPDWDADDCVNFLTKRCEGLDMTLRADAARLLQTELREIRSRPGWANVRDAEHVYDLFYKARAMRCRGTAEAERSILLEDASAAMEELRKLRPAGEPIARGRSAHQQMFAAHLPLVASQVALLPPRASEAMEVEEMEECTEAVEETHQEQVQPNDNDDNSEIFAALMLACREAGYDADHEHRLELIEVLTNVMGGHDFPQPLLQQVCEKTATSADVASRVLKPQVPRVLAAMRSCCEEEERWREEVRRLKEEERAEELRLAQERHERELRTKERVRRMCRCPAGFDWHRVAGGWRCNGGSHLVTDAQLPAE